MKNLNQGITTETERRRLNIAALEKLLGCSRQTIWRWYTTRDFPKPHYLGQNRLWLIDEVEDWLEEQISHTSKKNVRRKTSDKQIAQPSSADSYYTRSGSSPPNVTSSKEGGAA